MWARRRTRFTVPWNSASRMFNQSLLTSRPHPCKSSVKGEARDSRARSGDRALKRLVAVASTVHSCRRCCTCAGAEPSTAERRRRYSTCTWASTGFCYAIRSGSSLRICGLSAVGPCTDAEPYIHLRPRTPKSRRRRLSLCSLPVPKQFVVSLRSLISFAQWPTCETWQSAHGMILIFPFLGRFLRCRGASELLGGQEILFSAFYGKQIGNDLPCYGQRGPVAIASLHLLLLDQRQFRALPGRQFRGFHQHVLNVFVALLGNGRAHHLIGGTLLRSAQSAIADGLFDGPKP